MQFGHLLVNCGPYRILVPGENIAAIDEGSDQDLVAISIRQARKRGWPLVIDARVLLGLDAAGRSRPRVSIQWHSTDNVRHAVLRVDGAESLHHGSGTDALKLPRVPTEFRDLFDGLVCDGGTGFLLRLRHDVCAPVDTGRRRERFVRAVLGALPLDNTVFNRMDT
jgi:hypothetical protein